MKWFQKRRPALGREGSVLILGLTAVAGCQAPASTAGGFKPSIPFTRERLENGLTVIYHQDHRLPLVTLNTWYYVGSKDEPPHRSGFAHLFEHLMFMGTERVPAGEFDEVMEGAGGSNNASTSADRTNYYDEGPQNLLPTLLYLEADRMEGFGRAIDQKKLDTQRGVVQNERRQSYENRPYGKAALEVWRLMYPPDHPYHEPVIGSHQDLESATVADVKDFFGRFYLPRNGSLVVAGDLDLARTRELVHQYYGKIPAGPEPRHAAARSPVDLKEVQRVTIPDRVQLSRVSVFYHSPPVFAEGDADLDLAASILGDGKSSRLYRALVYDKKIAQDVEASQSSQFLGSLFEIQVTARPGQELDLLERAVDEEIDKLTRVPPTQEEVEQARNRFEVGFWHRIESLGARADLLNHYQFILGTPDGIGRDLERYRKVTPQSIQKWARQVLRPKARLIMRTVPEGKPPAAVPGQPPSPPAQGIPPPEKPPEAAPPPTQAAPQPASPAPGEAKPPAPRAPGPAGPEPPPAPKPPEKAAEKNTLKTAAAGQGAPPRGGEGGGGADVSASGQAAQSVLPPHPPEAGPLKPFEPPLPQMTKLSSGIPIWCLTTTDVPLVTVVLVVRSAGAASDPPGKSGLASLTASMLDEGAGSRGPLELASELDLLGATLTPSANRERGEIRLSVLHRNLDRALDLFADVLLRPRFEPKEWDRVKTLTVNELVQRRDNPAAVARVVADRAFFGDSHPYGAPISGYADTVRWIDLQEAVGFYRSRWAPQEAAIAAAGDVSPEELRAKLEERLSGWKRQEAGSPSSPQPPALSSEARPRLVVVEKQGAPQTVISLAMPGIARTDPLYPDLLLANTVFGGSFTSRLNQNLREEHRYTYGASSNFQRLRGRGAFVVQTAVKSDVTGDALSEIAKEVQGMGKGLKPGELEKARATAQTHAVESLSTVASSAELWGSLLDLGLPPDEPRRLLKHAFATTADAVGQAARSIIRWNDATVVLVGDRGLLMKELEKAAKLLKEAGAEPLPEPVYADADGNRIPAK